MTSGPQDPLIAKICGEIAAAAQPVTSRFGVAREAGDLAQNAMIAIWKRVEADPKLRQRMQNDALRRTFIQRTLVRLALSALRRRGSHRTTSLGEEVIAEAAHPPSRHDVETASRLLKQACDLAGPNARFFARVIMGDQPRPNGPRELARITRGLKELGNTLNMLLRTELGAEVAADFRDAVSIALSEVAAQNDPRFAVAHAAMSFRARYGDGALARRLRYFADPDAPMLLRMIEAGHSTGQIEIALVQALRERGEGELATGNPTRGELGAARRRLLDAADHIVRMFGAL